MCDALRRRFIELKKKRSRRSSPTVGNLIMVAVLHCVVFLHGLSALYAGVLRQISGQHQLGGGLDLAELESISAAHLDQLGSFRGDFLEDINNEIVENVHGLLANTQILVNLLQDTVGVCIVGLVLLLLAKTLLHGEFATAGFHAKLATGGKGLNTVAHLAGRGIILLQTNLRDRKYFVVDQIGVE